MIGAVAVGSLVLSTAFAGEVEVKDNHFKFAGTKYYRGNAPMVQIGSYGQKKASLAGANKLAHQNNMASEHLRGRVQRVTTCTIAWRSEKKSDVEASGTVKFLGIKGGVGGSLSHEKLKDGRLVLVWFHMSEGDVRGAINNASGCRSYLKREGRDGRVVGDVFVAMVAELAQTVTNAASIEVGASVSVVTFKVKGRGKKAKTTTLTLSPGTTFAYSLYRVKKWNKSGGNKTTVRDLEMDEWGPN